MPEINSGDNGVWKNIALFLAGALLAGGGAVITLARDSISRTEVNEMIREVRAETLQQYAGLNGHLENTDRTQIEMSKELVRIAEHLGVRTGPPN